MPGQRRGFEKIDMREMYPLRGHVDSSARCGHRRSCGRTCAPRDIYRGRIRGSTCKTIFSLNSTHTRPLIVFTVTRRSATKNPCFMVSRAVPMACGATRASSARTMTRPTRRSNLTKKAIHWPRRVIVGAPCRATCGTRPTAGRAAPIVNIFNIRLYAATVAACGRVLRRLTNRRVNTHELFRHLSPAALTCKRYT